VKLVAELAADLGQQAGLHESSRAIVDTGFGLREREKEDDC
jgi:hypothetical protein